jgi:plastocyanin
MIRRKVLMVFFAVAFLSGTAYSRQGAAPAKSAGQASAAAQGATGEITGKVFFRGTPAKRAPIDMSKDDYCDRALQGQTIYPEDGAVNSNGTLPNAFIYVKHGAENYKVAIPSAPAILDQFGCMYQPHVLGIMAGQELQVVSSDPTTHNVHPMPKDNREWNQSQPPGAPPIAKKTFARPEIMIPVKCNEHPWMRAYIGVTNNPFYAVTGSDGSFTIKGLPPGDYTLETWTATFGTQERKVAVRPRASVTADFNFTAP